jgi:Protein of unknown function (DUF2442)
MAKSVHTAPKSAVRKNKQAHIKIISAAYLRDYKVLVLFSTNRMKVIDFAPALKKYAVGHYARYLNKTDFRKFNIENGNIVWGKNWDLIFPILDIFNGSF